MPTAADISSFLAAHGLAEPAPPLDDLALLTEITRIRTDETAEEGDLAWLSPREAGRDPARLERFAGSLLIAPLDAKGTPGQRTVVLKSAKPKLAFTQAVGKFFTSLIEIEWPTGADRNVHPSSRLGSTVQLGPGVVIGSSVELGDNVSIGPNTCLANCTIADGVRIGANCTIGLPGFGYERDEDGKYWRFPHLGRVVIARDVEIGSNTCIDRGAIGDTVIERGVKIDNLVHIAHNVVLRENVVVIANSMVAGSVAVDANAWIAPSAAIKNKVVIGHGSVVGLGAVVLKDVAPHAVVVGNPARVLDPERKR